MWPKATWLVRSGTGAHIQQSSSAWAPGTLPSSLHCCGPHPNAQDMAEKAAPQAGPRSRRGAAAPVSERAALCAEDLHASP